jgi:hypothetical protein
MDTLKKQLEINEALVTERFKTWLDIKQKYKSVNVITSIYENDYLKAKKASQEIADKIMKLRREQEQELAEELDRELGLNQEHEFPMKKRKNPDITKINPVAKRPRDKSRSSLNYEGTDEVEAVDLTEETDEDVEAMDEKDCKTQTKRWMCPVQGCHCSYQFLAWLNKHLVAKHPTYKENFAFKKHSRF